MLHHTGGWERFYRLNVHLTPNLGFEVFTYPLLSFLSPLAAERAFLTLYVVLLGLSVPIFLRAFGKPAFPLSYFLFVATFSKPLLMGFYSDEIGVPFLLFALALAWKVWRRSAATRFFALNLAALALFVIHLIPFALFLLSLGLLTLVERKRWRERIWPLAKLGATLAPCLAVFVLSFARRGARPAAAIHWSLVPFRMLRDLLSFSGISYSPWQALPAAGALVLAYLALREGPKKPVFAWRENAPEALARRFFAALIAVLLAVYFAAPDSLVGGTLLRLRLPPLILFFALPLMRPITPRISSRRFTQLAALVAAAAVIINAGVLGREGREVAEFMEGEAAPLPRGATVLTARFDRKKLRVPEPLMHVACYYGLRGAVDLASYLNYQDTDPYFQIHFRAPIAWTTTHRVFEYPRTIDWSQLPQVDFLFAWRAAPQDQARLGKYFRLFWQRAGGPLTIWERRELLANGLSP